MIEKIKCVGIRIICGFKDCCKFCFGLGGIMVGKIKHVVIPIYKYIKRHFYQILYPVMLFFLWKYIFCNWEQCISMQFFSQFDGNNILFLVGILLVILPFYEIEGGGIKIRKAGNKEFEKDLDQVESEYRKLQIQKIIVMQSQGGQHQTEATENE